MTLADEFRTRNFSIYGQWTGIICMVLCFALGIANIFNFNIIILFSVICLVSSFIILFIEVPLLLRICPTSSTFDNFIRRFATNWTRAAIYFLMSLIQWLSLATGFTTSLIAAAVLLLFASAFYALAALKHQEFMSSKTLGGQGVAQMIV
ncbi:hypothetical protein K402DRAFT_343768 [Aulographum hederae CBS 113979]|uniref:Golgi apparatus membrane protein TVP18 n=1 Tax=Aulographum hederae CBS 113979 TaxID=1176131 RepID=A0A6G1GJ26_9PEZI|nr:hypothetical protein K402DRAFT_343768 [Aulographum hederae CBS 113979]